MKDTAMPEKTILIVEDNEVQREGLTLVLRTAGYNVIAAVSGADAVAILEYVVTADLILLDMMIPPPDGWRFMAMRKNNPALAAAPVIIMTGLGAACAEWAEALGAFGFLRKPVDTGPLLAEVRRCLDEEQ